MSRLLRGETVHQLFKKLFAPSKTEKSTVGEKILQFFLLLLFCCACIACPSERIPSFESQMYTRSDAFRRVCWTYTKFILASPDSALNMCIYIEVPATKLKTFKTICSVCTCIPQKSPCCIKACAYVYICILCFVLFIVCIVSCIVHTKRYERSARGL